MSFANKLGPSYEANRQAVRTKTISIQANNASFELKVRIPLKKEMEEITSAISLPTPELVEKIYSQFADPLKKTINESGDDFMEVINSDGEKIKVLDNDLIVNGNSIRQLAQMTAIWQTQVERYFWLLQTPTGDPVDESYDEIAEEFPESVIREIITKIDEAIRPTLKDAKKN